MTQCNMFLLKPPIELCVEIVELVEIYYFCISELFRAG